MVSVSGRFVKTPMLRLTEVGVQDAQAADENRHLGRGQREQLRPVDEQLLGRHAYLPFVVVAESVGERFEDGEGLHVGLLLRGVHASRREGNRHGVAGFLRCLLDACAAAENDQIGKRDLLAAGLRRR